MRERERESRRQRAHTRHRAHAQQGIRAHALTNHPTNSRRLARVRQILADSHTLCDACVLAVRRTGATHARTLIHSYTHTLIHSYTHTLIASYPHTLMPSYPHTLIPSTHISHHSHPVNSACINGSYARARQTACLGCPPNSTSDMQARSIFDCRYCRA